jgi:hypothetical protein
MTRRVVLSEYANELMDDVLRDLNRRPKARGEDIEIVLSRPRPRLVSERDEVVVPLRAAKVGSLKSVKQT